MTEAMNYLKPNICAECGGKCCQRLSGCALPEDITRIFAPDLGKALIAAFETGNWVVDWWEGDPRGFNYDDPRYVSCGFYVRPRVLTDIRGGLYCASWGGECCFWTPEGCILASDERPWGCRMLEPKEDGECICHGGGKKRAALAWLEFHDIIETAAELANLLGW